MSDEPLRYSSYDIMMQQDGKWVSYSDFATLRAQVAALTAERDNMRQRLIDTTQELADKSQDLLDYIAALGPAPVRDEALIRAALEAAARVADRGALDTENDGIASWIADAIRALATPEGIAAIRERAKE